MTNAMDEPYNFEQSDELSIQATILGIKLTYAKTFGVVFLLLFILLFFPGIGISSSGVKDEGEKDSEGMGENTKEKEN